MTENSIDCTECTPNSFGIRRFFQERAFRKLAEWETRRFGVRLAPDSWASGLPDGRLESRARVATSLESRVAANRIQRLVSTATGCVLALLCELPGRDTCEIEAPALVLGRPPFYPLLFIVAVV